jgi:hypothetical protein
MNYPSQMDSMFTFKDGQELVLNTWHDGKGIFYCELFRRVTDMHGDQTCNSTSPTLDGHSCKEAQAAAYSYARDSYPPVAEQIKRPPYLIPAGSPGSAGPRWRSIRSRVR